MMGLKPIEKKKILRKFKKNKKIFLQNMILYWM